MESLTKIHFLGKTNQVIWVLSVFIYIYLCLSVVHFLKSDLRKKSITPINHSHLLEVRILSNLTALSVPEYSCEK
jgi:uncharacterized membrane protein